MVVSAVIYLLACHRGDVPVKARQIVSARAVIPRAVDIFPLGRFERQWERINEGGDYVRIFSQFSIDWQSQTPLARSSTGKTSTPASSRNWKTVPPWPRTRRCAACAVTSTVKYRAHCCIRLARKVTWKPCAWCCLTFRQLRWRLT